MDAPVANLPMPRRSRDIRPLIVLGLAFYVFASWLAFTEPTEPAAAQGAKNDKPLYTSDPNDPFPMPAELIGVELMKQSDGDKQIKSAGCIV